MAGSALQASLVLLALAWAGAVAVVDRPRVGLAAVGLGAILALVTPALESIGAWPANLTATVLGDTRTAEALALVVAIESLGGIALLATSTTWAAWITAMPTPSAVAMPPLMAHLALVYGPRWDLGLLAGSGWAIALLCLAAILAGVWRLSRSDMAAAYEAVLVLRATALVLAAAAMAQLSHRPAPQLPFEPLAMLASLFGCALLMSFGWWWRKRLL